MKSLIATGLFVLSLGVVAADPPNPDLKPANKADEKKPDANLEGGYTIVSGEEHGKPIPPERIKGAIVRFTDNSIIGTDKDKKEFFSATYTLYPTKTPWVIEMTSKSPREAKATGLVKKEGDTLTLIYALPGGDAPTEFKTKQMQQMFVLKAMKDDAKPNKSKKE